MPRGRPLEVELELLEAFKRSGAVSVYLVTRLPAAIWQGGTASGPRPHDRGDRGAHARCPAHVCADGRGATWSTLAR